MAAIFDTGAVDTGSPRTSEDFGKVAFGDRDAILEEYTFKSCVDHTPNDETNQPKGRVIVAFGNNLIAKPLRANHIWVRAQLVGGTSLKPVTQCLKGQPTPCTNV